MLQNSNLSILTSCLHGLPDVKCLTRFLHVVHAHDLRASFGGKQSARHARDNALGRIGLVGRCADRSLARKSHQIGSAAGDKALRVLENAEIVLKRLPKTETRVPANLLEPHALSQKSRFTGLEVRFDFAQQILVIGAILHGLRRSLHVHDHEPCAALCGHLFGAGQFKGANIIENAGAGFETGLLLTREGAAENGDTVDIDFEGFVDGVAFEGGKAEHYSLVLGSGSFIPGFEEQIVGHKAGEEFDVNVKFPEEYQAEELAGKDATFKIKLHEVQYKELPELDDDFAKDVSEYDTLDELKDSIRKGIETNHEKQADQKVENDLIDQVVGGMKAEIPDAMIESRIEELVQDFQYRISQQGLKLEQYLQYMGMTMEQFKEQFREQADKQVKMRLAMEAIVAKESIEATEEEFEAEIKRIADAYQMEADKVKSLVDAAAVKKDLAVNKAIDFVKSKANIVAGAAEEKKPAKKTTRKTTKKAAAKQDEEPKEEETKGE